MDHVYHEAIVVYIAHARVTFIDELVKRFGVKDIDYVFGQSERGFPGRGEPSGGR